MQNQSKIVEVFKFMKSKSYLIKGGMSGKGLCNKFYPMGLASKKVSEVRDGLGAIGFVPRGNNSIPVFENMRLAVLLFNNADFNEDCTAFRMKEVDKNTLTDDELRDYNELQNLNLHASEEDKYTKSFALERFKLVNNLTAVADYPVINGLPSDFDLEKCKVDFNDTNSKLPEGCFLVGYKNVLYTYVPNQELLLDQFLTEDAVKYLADKTSGMFIVANTNYLKSIESISSIDFENPFGYTDDFKTEEIEFYLPKGACLVRHADDITLEFDNEIAYHNTIDCGTYAKFYKLKTYRGLDVVDYGLTF